jgi:predicted nucleic-acid-binding Zn-ribbon protein
MAKIRCPKCGSENIKEATLVKGGYWLEGIHSPSPFIICRKCRYSNVRLGKARYYRIALLFGFIMIIFWIVIGLIFLR